MHNQPSLWSYSPRTRKGTARNPHLLASLPVASHSRAGSSSLDGSADG